MTILQSGVIPSTGGYQIERSLRFNSADSAYLNRTPASAGNRDTWTWSAWVKRSALATNVLFFAGTLGSNDSAIYFGGNNNLDFFTRTSSSLQGYIQTPAVFRDVSAWYHIVAVYDSGNATSADRMILYVNGTRQTVTVNNTLPQNTDSFINSNVAHQIGSYGSDYLNGYLTEINFIDGQALTPSSFGETDSATGVWKPKAFSGTYGTNGFYLKFADNSGTTSTTLGKDSSGNGNNWTPNNFSVTAGAGNDSLVDSPTAYGTDTGVGGEVRGNYATLNPIAIAHNGTAGTLSNGNLDLSTPVSGNGGTIGTIAIPVTGKWYWEFVQTGGSASSFSGIWEYTGSLTSNRVIYYGSDGSKYVDSVNSSYGATYGTNDIIGVAVDSDAGTTTFYKNNVSQGSISRSVSSGAFFPYLGDDTGVASMTFTVNFGQRPFAYTAPSGFKALCTQNLPTPTIGATSTTQANKYFNAVTYAGAGAGTVITTGFYPDFAWMKNRTAAFSNFVQDSVRGGGVYLLTDTTDADAAVSPSSTFSSTGITINANSSYASNSSYNYVAWAWKANAGSTVSNTAGTITSTVSANTTSGFSIVTYTGTGANATVGHGLGVTPAMYIVKRRTGGIGNWAVWHTGLSNTTTSYILLDSTAAQSTSTSLWGSTAATSTTLGLGTSVTTNNSSDTYVAYCFANVEGYSRAFSYTGNGSSDGPFVFLNFRPRYIIIKRTDSTSDWAIHDTARNTYNTTNSRVWASSSSAEVTSTYDIDLLSNGFKFRTSSANESGGTYIGFAFAENPFKYSLGR